MLLKTNPVFSPLNSGRTIILHPPKRINQSFYICDKKFYLEPILEMFKNENSNGVVFISGKMYAIYLVTKSGLHLESKKLVSDDNIDLPNHHKKGGQSQNRYQRITKELNTNYITKLSELVIRSFMSNNNTEYIIDKLIIAGPSSKKNLLAENSLVKQYFGNKTIIIDTPNINEEVIHNTIQNTIYIFHEDKEKYYDEVLNSINDLMVNNCDKLIFGLNDVVESINNKELEQVIIDETLEDFIKNNIKNLEKCIVIPIPSYRMNKIGLNVIGIRWY